MTEKEASQAITAVPTPVVIVCRAVVEDTEAMAPMPVIDTARRMEVYRQVLCLMQAHVWHARSIARARQHAPHLRTPYACTETHAHAVIRDTCSYPCLDTGGASYGSSSFPRTFGSGGGRSCYYYGSCGYYGVGGRGGGRIYMNASSIEITSGATISADGTEGRLYSSSTSRYRHLKQGRVVGLDVVLNLESGSGNATGGLLLNLQHHHELDRSTRWHGC